jgi:putative Mg2+ transporter-C (MgtC) family protein
MNLIWEIDWQLLVLVAVALGCGAVLGSEREIRDHPAGLRTIMLISAGSCLFIQIGVIIARELGWPDDVTRIDPGRIPSYVVAGIGFLGAGPIIAHRGRVRGLTTAATIWLAAGIGMLVGLRQVATGLMLTLAVTALLFVLRPVSHALNQRGKWRELWLCSPDDELQRRILQHYFDAYPAEVHLEGIDHDGQEAIVVHYREDSHGTHDMLKGLADLPVEIIPSETAREDSERWPHPRASR